VSHPFVNKYYDRYRKEFLNEEIYASRFLYWMYNTRLGTLATDIILKRRAFSRLYGWLHRFGWSRKKIGGFVKTMGIDATEIQSGLGGYASFRDFFTREPDRSNRPINQDPQVCISPVDGKVLAYASIKRVEPYRIKRSSFTLGEFVRDEALAEVFLNGAMVVCRLSLGDYHQFYFPDSGRPAEAVDIQGFCHAGGPYSLRNLIPNFTENHRMKTLFESDHFSRMLIVEIGALTVGSIIQTYRPGKWASKGTPKGYFDLGSTVVLLFQKDTIEIDHDLLANTAQEIETNVRFGDSLGRVPGSMRAK
jgi:phosphatidylserine decarboxylase